MPIAPLHNDARVILEQLRHWLANGRDTLWPYRVGAAALGTDLADPVAREIFMRRVRKARQLAEKEFRLIIGPAGGKDHGQGLLVLSDPQKIEFASAQASSLRRRSNRALEALATCNYEQLPADLKRAHDVEALRLGLAKHICGSRAQKCLADKLATSQELLSQKAAVLELFR